MFDDQCDLLLPPKKHVSADDGANIATCDASRTRLARARSESDPANGCPDRSEPRAGLSIARGRAPETLRRLGDEPLPLCEPFAKLILREDAGIIRADWERGNAGRKRRERKGAKAQGRKGKRKKGTQRCKGARTQREEGVGSRESGVGWCRVV